MDYSVGVVIPTYNRCDLTIRAVISVVNQTLKADQIVVVDDGSHPSIFVELQAKLAQYPVELVGITHSGNPGHARKIGTEFLRTKFVTFLDSDDYWLPEKLETQLKQAVEKNLSAICSNAFTKDDDGLKNQYFSKEQKNITFNNLLRKNSIICSSVFLDRELLIECGSFATASAVQGAEDYATWLRIASKEKWTYINEPLIAYSVENIDHFSHLVGNHLEIQVLTDFALWQKGNNQRLPIPFRLAVRVLRMSLMKIGR